MPLRKSLKTPLQNVINRISQIKRAVTGLPQKLQMRSGVGGGIVSLTLSHSSIGRRLKL